MMRQGKFLGLTPAIVAGVLVGGALLAMVLTSSMMNGLFGKDKNDVAETKDAAVEKVPKDPNLMYVDDFEKAKPGKLPGNYFVLDGDFEIIANEGKDAGQVLKLLPSKLVEASIQFGASIEGGGSVKVRAMAEKRGRSYPRFGVGLHGMKGFRLRVAPAAKKLELVRDQVVIQAVPFDWTSGIWYFVELSVVENNTSWMITGRAWSESEDRPKDGLIDHIFTDEIKFKGKASITGTPYAELPIFFDDLEIRKLAAGIEKRRQD